MAAKAFADLKGLQKLDLSRNKLTVLRHKTVETIKGDDCNTLDLCIYSSRMKRELRPARALPHFNACYRFPLSNFIRPSYSFHSLALK